MDETRQGNLLVIQPDYGQFLEELNNIEKN